MLAKGFPLRCITVVSGSWALIVFLVLRSEACASPHWQILLLYNILNVVYSGVRGIVKGVHCGTFQLELALLGHGNAVNDMKRVPTDFRLLLTASKDESIRLWNTETKVCIAIFAGEQGHRDEVLSVDCHPLGNCFASSGMDTRYKNE